MTFDSDHLRLAGVTRLSLSGRGPRDAYVFDPHRLALPCWALALRGRPRPALLVTLDRHFDLAAPGSSALPAPDDLQAVDTWARHTLDVRNVDHILAAMELGLVGDVIAVARAWPRGAIPAPQWTDRHGRSHRFLTAPTLERLLEQPDVSALLHGSETTLLDVDLDCFTTPSDADPTTLVPWPRELIHDFLFPDGHVAFWDALLPRCAALTLAREPYHCGGLVAAGRLFEQAASVLFEELLQTDLP